MPHQRPMPVSQPVQQMPQRKVVGPQQMGPIVSSIQEDIKALNSSILILSQKVNQLSRNEKMLQINQINLVKYIKKLEGSGTSGSGISEAGLNELRNQIDDVLVKLNDYGQKILEMQASIDEIKDRYAKQEELKELKYVIDSIHPLEFITAKQVGEILDKRFGKKK